MFTFSKKKNQPQFRGQPMHYSLKRLQHIDADESYPMSQIPVPEQFCDTVENLPMNNPVVLDKSLHTVDASKLEKLCPNDINLYTNKKRVILPPNFNSSNQQSLLSSLRNKLQTYSKEQKAQLKIQIDNIQEQLDVYSFQTKLRNQLETFIQHQEKIYQVYKQMQALEINNIQLQKDLEHKEIDPKKLKKYFAQKDQIIWSKLALRDLLEDFINELGGLIIDHEHSTDLEKKEEIENSKTHNKVLEKPLNFHESIKKDLSSYAKEELSQAIALGKNAGHLNNAFNQVINQSKQGITTLLKHQLAGLGLFPQIDNKQQKRELHTHAPREIKNKLLK